LGEGALITGEGKRRHIARNGTEKPRRQKEHVVLYGRPTTNTWRGSIKGMTGGEETELTRRIERKEPSSTAERRMNRPPRQREA